MQKLVLDNLQLVEYEQKNPTLGKKTLLFKHDSNAHSVTV